MEDNKNETSNIVWHQSDITKEDRQKLHGHKSLMIWFTGLSGSGKSTIANALQHELYKDGSSVYLLDGDNLRHGINRNLTFTEEDRKENVRRTAEVGKLFVDAGVVVLAALISPYAADREQARILFEPEEFVEVYVKCSLQECEKRDPKGLYKRARLGEIKQFTGISQPYEEPQNPEITIDTTVMSVKECVQEIQSYLKNKIHLREEE
ncbi:adenylyl-sulfate kinase [Alkalihalobacterium chitinilyticum]|uniref:Adenylyl-sulfate kinase n=1 Tax=Alkalihalobacterium chitinilyticum TaxID=2980103 RepID=A0ABT5VBY5_9BACI|nr:adenylyl-sulfate kinase [Alkalihalobacterium chitinilyticum]MDE5412666.1 adenylyl-sulfate kinase [Alkalihalobacterium chitinilyticum]